MLAYLYPGQGNQFPGMGKDFFQSSKKGRELFLQADLILGFSISEIMFEGETAKLNQTKYAQAAICVYSYIRTQLLGDSFTPEMVAGHSLGKISALAAIGAIDFESALQLIAIRSKAMQKVCEIEQTGMTVVVSLFDIIVKDICAQIDGIIVPVNYNTLNQVVISGHKAALKEACNKLRPGAKILVDLPVNGAFHSPYMQPVVEVFSKAVEETSFKTPVCPIYQNIAGRPTKDIELIKKNLILQLTNPVMWRHTILHMIEDGATDFTEIVPGKLLNGFVRQIDKKVNTHTLDSFEHSKKAIA